MHDVVYPAAAVVTLVAFLYKLWDVRRDPGNRGARAVCAALFFPVVAFTLATPPIYAAIDGLIGDLIGFPNWGKILVHGSLIIFSALIQRVLLIWTYPIEQARPRIRRRMIAAGVILVLMTICMYLADLPTHVEHFAQTYATAPWVAPYLLLYLGGVMVALLEIARLCWSYSQAAGRPWLRRGLRLSAIGAAVNTGYCLCRGIYVILRNVGVDIAALADVAPAFAGLGGSLVVIGLTLPSWGPRVSAAKASVDRYHAHLTLHPLWADMVRAAPGSVLPSGPGQRARWSVLDLRLRLIREVAEIQDARMSIGEYLSPAVGQSAHDQAVASGLSGQDAAAVAEAAMLTAGLQAASAGRKAASAREEPVSPWLEDSGSSDETEWLVQVARAYRHSPIVRTVTAGTGSTGSDAEGMQVQSR